MKKNIIITIIFSVVLVFLSINCSAQNSQQRLPWNVWVQQLKQEAVSQGIDPHLFDRLFADIKQPERRVLHLDRTQPERRLTFMEYRKTRIDPYRIRLGVREYKRHRQAIDKIASHYGVNPCFIVAFWGIESSYGRYMGSFPVINSLATLAYDNRRGDFFRKQLLIALHILNEGHVDLKHFKGEWAGASGHAQFLPSSWKNFAVDWSGDGKKNIWTNLDDAFASIANYMKQNGWRQGEPWSTIVKLPANFNKDLEGLDIVKPMNEWLRMGVKPASGQVLPNQNLPASIITPTGGPTFMAFPNYKVIMSYNNSIFYAGAVGYLADQICERSK